MLIFVGGQTIEYRGRNSEGFSKSQVIKIIQTAWQSGLPGYLDRLETIEMKRTMGSAVAVIHGYKKGVPVEVEVTALDGPLYYIGTIIRVNKMTIKPNSERQIRDTSFDYWAIIKPLMLFVALGLLAGLIGLS